LFQVEIKRNLVLICVAVAHSINRTAKAVHSALLSRYRKKKWFSFSKEKWKKGIFGAGCSSL
jgi:hypothetical protein